MSVSPSFYSTTELHTLGLKSFGNDVLISRKCSIYGASNISIGNNVRIDDFCILSGNIELGSYIHISAYCALYGGDSLIKIDDFSGLSARVTIYSISDDFSGDYMVGSMIDDKYRNIISGVVYLEKYVQIGANCVVLPNLTLHEGVAVGAMSLVNRSLQAWGIYAGIPCKSISERSKNILTLSEQAIKDGK